MPEPVRSPIRDQAGADALVSAVSAAMRALEGALATESEAVRAGNLRNGLSNPEHKSALAAVYMQHLELVKANAVALARFSPQGVQRLRDEHRRFMEAVAVNQAVLGTAHSVAEGLIKSLAAELGKAATPTVYGVPSVAPSPYGRGPRSGPIVLSRSL